MRPWWPGSAAKTTAAARRRAGEQAEKNRKAREGETADGDAVAEQVERQRDEKNERREQNAGADELHGVLMLSQMTVLPASSMSYVPAPIDKATSVNSLANGVGALPS